MALRQEDVSLPAGKGTQLLVFSQISELHSSCNILHVEFSETQDCSEVMFLKLLSCLLSSFCPHTVHIDTLLKITIPLPHVSCQFHSLKTLFSSYPLLPNLFLQFLAHSYSPPSGLPRSRGAFLSIFFRLQISVLTFLLNYQ